MGTGTLALRSLQEDLHDKRLFNLNLDVASAKEFEMTYGFLLVPPPPYTHAHACTHSDVSSPTLLAPRGPDPLHVSLPLQPCTLEPPSSP